jgi:23S rRNA (uracil1939-C5)-methyltransferase
MTFEIELQDMAATGTAVGRCGGKVVFVPFGIPGETVRVETVKETGSWILARIQDIRIPSASRRVPLCSYFGDGGCGGCHWQHIPERDQREYKTRVIREQFRRIGKIEEAPVSPTASVGKNWGYRNHCRLHFSDGGYGFISALRDRVVPIRDCPILVPEITETLHAVIAKDFNADQISIRRGTRTGISLVVADGGSDPSPAVRESGIVNLVWRRKMGEESVFGKRFFYDEAAGFRFRISAGSFFQVNTPGADELVKAVLEFLSTTPEQSLLELYSGVGLFTVVLGRLFRRVTAVEIEGESLNDARINLDTAGFPHVRLIEGAVREVLKKIKGDFSAVLLDPPRKGCGPEVVDSLAALRPERIVYVSCDPATLARDAKSFAGKIYFPTAIQPLDFFPQTFHVETVCLFEPG